MVVIYYDDTLKDSYSFSEVEEFVKKLNSICDVLERGMYREGYRNNIAVDLCICCYVLGLEPTEVAEMAWADSDNKDLADLKERVDVIVEYLNWWNRSSEIDNYMLVSWRKPEKEWFTLI